jgi:hypothetical protein
MKRYSNVKSRRAAHLLETYLEYRDLKQEMQNRRKEQYNGKLKKV